LGRLKLFIMEETYKGKIDEFVDWVTGDNEITG
jgi:hypothetical protein